MSPQAFELDLGSWRPTVVGDDMRVDPAPVAALQSLLDDGLAPVGPGDQLPPLWHWAALARWSRSSVLGEDGHPRRGSFMPPIALPRRVFAGGEVTFHQPITVGDVIHRESEVLSVQHKQGRSGDLVIVRVATRIHLPDGSLALEERQDIAYAARSQRFTDADRTSASVDQSPASPFRRTGEWSWTLRTDPSLLMRFSAATANAHRIHYDRPHATGVEGYPNLVVHGPLMTVALAETIRLECPNAVVQRMAHRNRSPLFCGEPAALTLTSRSDLGDGSRVDVVLSSEGTVRSELAATLLTTAAHTNHQEQQEGHHRA
jgi:3-methylfumaryl-CoA hydratase